MKLVIDRNRWLRGEGGAVSKLHRISDGKMCCLGFFCYALGASDLEGFASPYSVGAFRQWFGDEHGWHPRGPQDDAINNLIALNDSETLSESSREQAIKYNFAELDVEVEFIN